MKNPKFQLFKSELNSQFYFHLKAANGEIILSSEGYITRQNALNGIYSAKDNALIDEHYERIDKPGSYTFNLKAANGEIVGRSESYESIPAREKGIAAVKDDAPDAGVEELH